MATVNLSWTPATGANITEQRVYRGTVSNSLSLLASGLSPTASTYADTTALSNTTYYYRIDSICTVGGPAGSNTLEVVIACTNVTVGTFTAEALDTANAGGPSTGNVQIGYGSTTTGGAVKSSGLATVNVSGSPTGGTLCDTGFITVTAAPPISSFSAYVTVIRVYLNSVLLGSVYGPYPGEGGTTVQTFNYSRSLNDTIHIQFDSEVV